MVKNSTEALLYNKVQVLYSFCKNVSFMNFCLFCDDILLIGKEQCNPIEIPVPKRNAAPKSKKVASTLVFLVYLSGFPWQP
jgi:hypothetical protein